MRRREFLWAASGGAAVTAAGATAGVAQETTTTPGGNATASGGNQTAGGNQTTTGGGGGGETVQVDLVDYAYEPGTEEPLYISPGTTVNFVWQTNTHNIVVDSQPEGANWAGYEPIENSGFEYAHTFETMGEYAFHCQPHANLGMEATIIVNEAGAPPGGEGGGEVDPEHMGVAFQAHFVGAATIVALIVALIFTFFFLKYGETPHSGYPEEE